ncbi:MAG: folate-binding protein [Alphaproteobacteria bacterium]|nr:folate-binding protein [Alphaproteobacteria bacterium]
MSDNRYVMLERGVLAITGEEARPFLQGLISNDIEKVGPDRAIYAALLTPQGKCLFDFFIAQREDGLFLDVEAHRLPALLQRLTMYKLRAKVDIADVSGDFCVAALLGASVFQDVGLSDQPGAAAPLGGGVAFVDPRLSALGARAILPKASAAASLEAPEALGLQAGPAEDYDRTRFAAGVPEGSTELGIDKSPLLELGFEELGGVDFDKGCFVGQELTARMKYRGLVRKRLLPVTFEGGSPPPGAVIKAGARTIGELRAATGDRGFAVLRIDKLKESVERGETLSADDVIVTPVKPAWVNF